MNWKRVRKERQRVAYDHILHLYDLAVREVPDHPERARRYIEIVRAISRKHKATLAPAMKRSICKSCNMPLLPGRTAQVRVRPGRTVITCLTCGKVHRYPYFRELRERRMPRFGAVERKTPGGLVRVAVDARGGRIMRVRITGDFFMHPDTAAAELERVLSGLSAPSVPGAVASFFADRALDMPGVPIDTLISLILEALDKGTPVRT